MTTEKRTVSIDGVAVPACVSFEDTRTLGVAISYRYTTHRDAFLAAVKAAGAKWLPGTKQWALPAEKASAVLLALHADGFGLDGFAPSVDPAANKIAREETPRELRAALKAAGK